MLAVRAFGAEKFRSSGLGTVSRRVDTRCTRSARGVARPRPRESISGASRSGAAGRGTAQLTRAVRRLPAVASSDGPLLNREGPPFGHGRAIRPRGPPCGACAAPRGPRAMVTRRLTDSLCVHMPPARSPVYTRDVFPPCAPRARRVGHDPVSSSPGRKQFTVCRRPLTTPTTLLVSRPRAENGPFRALARVERSTADRVRYVPGLPPPPRSRRPNTRHGFCFLRLSSRVRPRRPKTHPPAWSIPP